MTSRLEARWRNDENNWSQWGHQLMETSPDYNAALALLDNDWDGDKATRVIVTRESGLVSQYRLRGAEV